MSLAALSATVAEWDAAELPPLPLRRFSVAEYRRMGEIGVLTEDDRIELLEGWIVQKMNHNPRHDAAVDLVDEALGRRLPAEWRVRVQSSISTDDSDPEPDHAVVRGPARRYAQRHPEPGDIGMLAEVSDTSLPRDRGMKQRIYARAGIAVYWIVNLIDSQIEVYTSPTGPTPPNVKPTYQQKDVYKPGGSVPLIIAGQHLGDVPVSELLP
ncbi:MAG: Uma2 family endonuclease [Planctomycetaceae bacterium]